MDHLGSLEVRWVQGFTGPNVHFVDKKTVCYTSGNFVVFADLETNKRRTLQGPGRSIGVLAASAPCRVLAFSEPKLEPSIFVYSYPALALRSQLRGTAKLDYTCVALSGTGPYLACCSSTPDPTLSVWNWETEAIICRKALDGREVTGLTFNPLNWQQMCAVRASCITVWNIEKCENLQIIKSSVIDLPATESQVKGSAGVSCQGSEGSFTYLGPQMSVSAITGLVGEEAAKRKAKGRLCGSALCWTAASQLYVGCKEGHLLQVDLDSQSVSVLSDPRAAVKKESQLRAGSLCSLALSRDALFAAGEDRVLRCLHIKGSKVEVKKLSELEEPITDMCFSPECDTLLLSSCGGHVFRYRPLQSDRVVRVPDVVTGRFVAAVPLAIDSSFCVSVQDNGELQLRSMDTGSCVRSLSLSVQVSSLASCPSALYVAVGTAAGHVFFVDLTQKLQPRVVHQQRLHHVAIEHLAFDQRGNVLLAGASDSLVFILDARPSRVFEIIGYTEACGAVLAMSTRCSEGNAGVRVLLLCSAKEGCRLEALDLPLQQLTGGQGCADPQGRLPDALLHKQKFDVAEPLSSAVLGPDGTVFSYCAGRKSLQMFTLPESAEPWTADELVHLEPDQEADSHPLSPAAVILSPHHCWLASAGKDGELRVCDTSSMERYLQTQCHSCWLGGARTVSFSTDGRSLVTIGSQDKSLVCACLRMKAAGAGEVSAAAVYGQGLAAALKPSLVAENPVLSRMPVWDPKTSALASRAPRHGGKASDRSRGLELVEQDDGQEHRSDTWLDRKVQEVLQKEREHFSEERKNLQKAIRELRNTVQAMMRENELLPDIEKLEHLEFNLNVEEQMRLQAEGEEEVARVRNEIELENLAKAYLREVLKRDCWDSMKVKGQAIKAFHSDHEVMNYPMKERTEKELENLQRVQRMRAIEQMDHSIQLSFLEKMTRSAAEKEEELEDKDDEESVALAGSLSAQFGGRNPYLYSQFELFIREQKVHQITLLQDVIYEVKSDFNKQFNSVFKQKEQEISRVKERNKRIAEIMAELDLKGQLWEPTLTDIERPERDLVVLESEFKVEKYLRAEDRLKEEALKKAEEQRRLAAKGDNLRERALDDMMGGVLEVKKEEILKMEIPQPEFMTKPEVQWTEEEKKSFKAFEKKVKELSEEQEKYRKALEAEMKKLQTSNKEATQGFDQVLRKLFERKVKTEMVTCQEELKIANLVYSILIEEEIFNRETELSNKLQKARTSKNDLGEEVRECKEKVNAFKETYDNIVAEDKQLDKSFKKEFSDVPLHLVDQLYKLYKRRPWVQRMRVQSGRAAGEGLDQLKKAIEELDSPENMPEGLDSAAWERFCVARRTKVDSEQKVKQKALMLAEMQAFLQRRMDEDERVRLEVKNIMEELRDFNEEKMRFRLNIMVQILIKQGQVEVEKGNFITDLSDSLLIHRRVVEDLNTTIKTLGEQKIARMVECKDYRKGIIQMEWERRRLAMLKEDLQNKARDIQRLRVSQEQQEYLSEADNKNRTAKQLSTMEKNITLQEKIHQKNVSKAKMEIQKLNKQATQWAVKSRNLDSQLAIMSIGVAEIKNIYEAAAVEETPESSADRRYQDILQRKRLVMLSQAQSQELSVLRAEVERLRMKNFPALVDPDQ
ncbi:cilia- and flagella-associated protein 43 isoform X2 [Scleropages formosus]|uniref:cilia- and flagella-associated protein 43 isoform X2 n=1 Tax=Scleropages formosus TaxID=113540 RepID=UPI0010FA8699|nr:cilia- and flagella-associated protein 43 isoform X2 [Scleropages formosus]